MSYFPGPGSKYFIFVYFFFSITNFVIDMMWLFWMLWYYPGPGIFYNYVFFGFIPNVYFEPVPI